MATFILSFVLIFFMVLAMAVSIVFGKAGIKTGCAGYSLTAGASAPCQQCNCHQPSASAAE